MKKLIVPLLGLSVALLVHPAYSALIHESASLGPTGQEGGTSIQTIQFLGSRFTVTSTVQVEAIGGHLTRFEMGNNLIFGAIVNLSSPTALPTGSPFDMGEVVASANFTPPLSTYFGGPGSDDILVPLSVTLTPGSYGLVFGSGLFGTSGNSAMTHNNTDLPDASYFLWNGGSWADAGSAQQWRFVVSGDAGTVIPEPSTMALLLAAIPVLGIACCRRKRSNVA